MLVVEPDRRYTLSQILSDPWMDPERRFSISKNLSDPWLISDSLTEPEPGGLVLKNKPRQYKF